MTKEWIKNFDQIATSDNRKLALSIIQAGLDAIDTEKAIASSVTLDGRRLKIKDQIFDLDKFKKVVIIGFGKVACRAAAALEKILGDRITDGIVIDTNRIEHEHIRTFVGTHPMPSPDNLTASKEIVDLAESLGEDDLAIVVVSGGGSALLCWPNEECEQGQRLYQDFLKTDGTIKELNTVRKHISLLKGGGLAKFLYPAKVVGLIFSDVPGDEYNEVASGPTYMDSTTADDAKAITDKYGLIGYRLTDTPKDGKYFERVINIPVVSNESALDGMAKMGNELGLKTSIISNSLYESPPKTAELIFSAAKSHDLILAGGEIRLKVKENHGSGGRNQFLAMQVLSSIGPGQTFIALASDGRDNGPAAGAIVDSQTLTKVKELGLDTENYIKHFDAFAFFKKVGDLIFTGPTEENVSDLVLLLNK